MSPELVAWKTYGIDTLKWVVMAAAGLDDTRSTLASGSTLYLPSALWIRERIKHYCEMEQK